MGKRRVVVDSRRKINSGVGRVSQWLTNHLAPQLSEFADVTHLVKRDARRGYQFNDREVLETEITPFSRDDFVRLPDLLSEARFDLYVNPNGTWSPLHDTPTINMVHDLWTIEHSEWLPTETDLRLRFGLEDASLGPTLTEWFESVDASEYFTPEGLDLWSRRHDAGVSPLFGAALAQLGVLIRHSLTTVAVSAQLGERLRRYFANADSVLSIPIDPMEFRQSGPRRRCHFLSLAKVEPRKNLELLLDAYSRYAESLHDRALALVVAGDSGYGTTAAAFHARLDSMRSRGMDVRFVDSAPEDLLASLLRDAAALVNTSFCESVGLPVLEAMLAEVPVISTATGVLDSDLRHYATIIDADDPARLSAVLLRATTGVPHRRQLSDARKAVRGLVAENQADQRWLSLIRNALESLGTGGP